MATTHWSVISTNPEAGEIRERELQKEFWAETLTHGACYRRIQTPQQDIRDTIESMLTKQFETVATKIQEELVEKNLRVAQTEAGKTLIDAVQKRLRVPTLLPPKQEELRGSGSQRCDIHGVYRFLSSSSRVLGPIGSTAT
jgi:hypothetical protein